MERIERTALSNLIHNEEYTRKVLPFIKEEYFADRLEGLLFSEIYKFVEKYNSLPTKESLSIEINSNSCLLYTSPSPRDRTRSRMPSSA